jgi:hypothetical protein
MWEMINEITIGTCNVCTMCTVEAINKLVNEMDKYKGDICDLQEIRWPGKETVIKKKYILYSRHKVTHVNLEQDFILWIFYFDLMNERVCKINVKLKYYKLTLTSTHANHRR